MQHIHLTRVAIKDADKDGNQYVNRFTGKPQKRIGIQCFEYGKKWLSDFINSPSDPRLGWASGQEVTIIAEQKGDFINFRLPTETDLLKARMDKVEERMKAIETFFTNK